VLVLPFDNLSVEKGGPPYDDIASAELTSGLARHNPTRLSVIDPMTARKFKNTKECIIKIGNQLGADYVLLGDVQQSDDTVKVDAQLFRVSTNRQVWATEQRIPRDPGFSKVWAGMTNSIASTLDEAEVAKK
jgi:TolB-like protein